ncbi:homoserine/homoserine lactone efflux protein [Vibrio artabrorum]|uniref:Homoserine/homoserine lactone efflux protein n=1 Tax=Vibrio artabrorum TaxID=446374 RepID=A0ABT8CG40_9VIBR|nr:homoserine/homoserine lactone efflux protein [Vibrio artabrorum]MDN3700697.1 homoserine/homoserine lactone efflux protein [Vibrio artabrorum]
MDTHVWLAYVVTAILFSLAPGSGTVNSISNGLSYGTKKSLASIVGLQLGLAFHIILVGAGIGALVAQSALVFTIIKWVGVVYLLWLGIQKWRDKSSLVASNKSSTLSSGKLLRNAVFINLTNPKSIVFLVALFPQFIDPAQPQAPQLLVLGITTILIDSLVMLGYTSLASKVRRFICSDRIMGKINKIFGGMFMGCGVLLAAAKA